MHKYIPRLFTYMRDLDIARILYMWNYPNKLATSGKILLRPYWYDNIGEIFIVIGCLEILLDRCWGWQDQKLMAFQSDLCRYKLSLEIHPIVPVLQSWANWPDSASDRPLRPSDLGWRLQIEWFISSIKGKTITAVLFGEAWLGKWFIHQMDGQKEKKWLKRCVCVCVCSYTLIYIYIYINISFQF